MIIRKSKVGVFVGLITGPENHSRRPRFISKVLTEKKPAQNLPPLTEISDTNRQY